jgi:hypothetical protein
MRQAGAIIRMEGTALKTVNSPVFFAAPRNPTLGPRQTSAHTRGGPRELGYAETEIESMVRAGAMIAAGEFLPPTEFGVPSLNATIDAWRPSALRAHDATVDRARQVANGRRAA